MGSQEETNVLLPTWP